MARGRHGSHGEGKQGTARAGNSREGDLLKTTKQTMPKSIGIQAQADAGVELGRVSKSERMRFNEPAKYPHGLA